MELRQLRYFAGVARHGSFTRAADELHVAQSAVSQQVRRLEAELGVELLARTTRRVEMTEAGEITLARASRVLAEVEALGSELDELSGLVRGHLTVGGVLPAGGYDLPDLLLRFNKLHPNVELGLREGTASSMAERLLRDELDVAIAMFEPGEVPAGLASRQLGHEALVVGMAPDDELSERKRIRLNDLEGRSFVTFRENAAVRATVDEALASANVSVRLAFETNDLAMMRAVIARGLGVAIVPETVAATSGPDLAWRPLTPNLRRTVMLVWREARRQPPAAAAFIAFIEHVAATVSGHGPALSG